MMHRCIASIILGLEFPENLQLGLLHVGGAGDVRLDEAVRLVNRKENVGLSSVILVFNTTLFLEGIRKVVDIWHGQVDLIRE